jgi:hypothetical protein
MATFTFTFLSLLIHNTALKTTRITNIVIKTDTTCFVNKLRSADEVQKRAFNNHLKSVRLFRE